MIAEMHERVIDSETGIIRYLTDIPIEPGEPQIFNFSAKMCDSRQYLPVGCYDSNGGAGLTREQAYSAAAGEAIERYCSSVYFHDEFYFGSYRDISKMARAIGPDRLTLFDERQSDARFPQFTDETRICWTQGRSLSNTQPVWLPACLVYIPYYPFYRDRGEVSIGPSISTGQACASTYAESVLRGICEVVERDAFSIAWLNRLPLPKLEIASSRLLERIYRERFDRKNLEYTLFDMTTDVQIAAVLCLLIDFGRDPAMICTGGAAHLNPEMAAVKALTEAAQTREWAKMLGNRAEPLIFETDFSNVDDFEKHVVLYAYGDMLSNVAFLRESKATRPFSDLPVHEPDNSEAAAAHAAAAIEAVNAEVLVVDITSEDVAPCGYSVVKAFIPEMQQLEGDHAHRFLGGKRLYEVPRRLGYLVESSYENLNTAPHPYP